jgi:hypothetical protein
MLIAFNLRKDNSLAGISEGKKNYPYGKLRTQLQGSKVGE